MNGFSLSGVQADQQLARALAEQAGQMLLRLQSEAVRDHVPAHTLKDLGDASSEKMLSTWLHEARPADAILSEEAQDSSRRLGASRVWIIDPLDGTKEFSEGRSDWAVHVALWNSGELTAGAVALPGLGTVLDSGTPLPERRDPSKPFRLAVSRSRPSPLAEALASIMNAELVPMGSAGYKAGAVIRGEADAYLHSGGQYEWDSAAPVAVAMSLGFHASRIDGTPLCYNQPDPYLPDLLLCHQENAGEMLESIDLLLKTNNTRPNGLFMDGMYQR
ncbi:3'(2'),5'-bisphosphate nucleotidase CysQ [Arthrobacter glacialis]|uniref:3'(2'),5'-bisphosphate nucleotidase CysQ n=1 Tax=Arthrobacter glacialis TaxID=1664 RepID=UPI000CD463F9|nr:3'(2'),5'-bisphosphate nucleotidase CysQ [Arthrobacter glacialis]POH60689.1 3'(2'),5'-bisphosphate nucleotidase CysQ [Arthrobacter glacialis]